MKGVVDRRYKITVMQYDYLNEFQSLRLKVSIRMFMGDNRIFEHPKHFGRPFRIRCSFQDRFSAIRKNEIFACLSYLASPATLGPSAYFKTTAGQTLKFENENSRFSS